MSIDKFPPELLTQVLSCLDLNDLLKCRLVCRQWKATIEGHIRIHGLTVQEKAGDHEQFLVFTTPSMDSNHRFVSRCSGNFTKSHFLKSVLKKLKKLSVNKSHFKVLRSLENLGVEHLFVRGVDRKIVIKSINLRTIAIELNPEKGKLRLNTPNLTRIDVYDYYDNKWLYENTLQFVGSGDPRSVTHLSALQFCEEFHQFTNLEVVYIGDSNEETPFTDFLTLFPALHLLHFARCKRADVEAILTSKRTLGRTDFKLYYLGMPIHSVKDLDRSMHIDGATDIGYVAKYLDIYRCQLPNKKEWVSPNERTLFRLLLSNYSTLPTPLPFNVFVNYASLYRHLNGLIDRGIFSRFVNIRFLNMEERIGDQEQFVWFARSCKQLEILIIKNAGLDQKFYDLLPYFWRRTPELIIDEEHRLDWNFLLSFNQLRQLTTSQDVPISTVLRAIRKFDELKYFEFKRVDSPTQIPFELIQERFPNRKALTEEQLIQCLRMNSYDHWGAYLEYHDSIFEPF